MQLSGTNSEAVYKHVMAGPTGNSEFCFPEILAEGNI